LGTDIFKRSFSKLEARAKYDGGGPATLQWRLRFINFGGTIRTEETFLAQ
jgi:hypothetical protein